MKDLWELFKGAIWDKSDSGAYLGMVAIAFACSMGLIIALVLFWIVTNSQQPQYGLTKHPENTAEFRGIQRIDHQM